MKRNTKTIIAIFLFLLVGACSSTQSIWGPGRTKTIYSAPIKTTEYKISRDATIGIVNLVEFNVTHYHIGTTVFNNFQKSYNVTWDIPKYIDVKTSENLKELGYVIKNIPINDELKKQLKNHVKAGAYKFSLNDAAVEELKKIEEQYNIDVLIVFETYKGMLGGAINKASGYGVYTDTFLGMGSAHGYANLSVSIIYMKDPTLLAYHQNKRITDLNNFVFPDNIKNIPIEEINKLESIIREIVDGLIDVISKDFQM